MDLDQIARGKKIKNDLFKNKIVLTAISTHSGEEKIILNNFKQLVKKYPNLVLCIVPRHSHRFSNVFKVCAEYSPNIIKKTEIKNNNILNIDILLGDTMGEIFTYLALSDLVFVGGSLVPVGGHNVVEPAALGLPIITGPYTHNFRKIIEIFKTNNAIVQLENNSDLTNQIIKLLENKELFDKIKNNAHILVTQNSGAKKRIMKIIHGVVDF